MLEENIMHLVAAVDRLTAAINKAQAAPEGVLGKPDIKKAGSLPRATVQDAGSPQGTVIAAPEKTPGEVAKQPKTSTSTVEASAEGKSSSGAASATPVSGAPSDSGAIDYNKDIFPLVTAAVARAGRDAVVKLIESYKPGVKKLSEAITPAQYAEVMDKLNALIGD